MKRIALVFAFALLNLALGLIHTGAPHVSAQGAPIFELACSAGTSPLAGWTTLKGITRKYRAYGCVDAKGKIVLQPDSLNQAGGNSFVTSSNTGTATQVLHSGSAPAFSPVSLTSDVSGILASSNLATQLTFGWGLGSLTIGNSIATCPNSTTADCPETVFANSHTLVRITFTLSTSPTARRTAAVIGVEDRTPGTVFTSSTISNGQIVGFVDSGGAFDFDNRGRSHQCGHRYCRTASTQSPVVFYATAVFKWSTHFA